MRETNKEDLKKAYKSEKDPRIKVRTLAMHIVRVRKKGIDGMAADLMQSERWVHNWLRRYDEGGPDDLRDLPRSNRSMQFRPTRARAGEAMPHRRGKPPRCPPPRKRRRKMLISVIPDVLTEPRDLAVARAGS